MKIALIGYGKMGKTIERIALERGHEIVSVIDVDNREEFESESFKSADVADLLRDHIVHEGWEAVLRCLAAEIHVLAQQLVSGQDFKPKPRAWCLLKHLPLDHHHPTTNCGDLFQTRLVLGRHGPPMVDLVFKVNL